MRDQQGVRRVDDDEVLDADGRDDAIPGMDVRVPRGDRDALALAAVALARRARPARRPPATSRCRSSRTCRARPRRRRRPPPSPSPRSRSRCPARRRTARRRSPASTRRFAAGRCRDRPHRVEHGRRVARERREDRRRREAEHARVPDVVAGGEVLARLLERRLLDEAARRERRRPVAGERLAAFDVAEAGLGMRRADAERDQRARSARGARRARPPRRTRRDRGSGDRPAARAARRRRRGAARTQSAASAMAGAVLRPKGSSRYDVRAGSLPRSAGVRVLRVKVVVAVGDGHELRDTGQRERARRGLREQRLAVGQRHRRLRRRLARQRPQPRAGAAGEDHGNDAAELTGGDIARWEANAEGLEIARVYPMYVNVTPARARCPVLSSTF